MNRNTSQYSRAEFILTDPKDILRKEVFEF